MLSEFAMGAKDPFLTAWNLDTYSAGSAALKSGQALASRLKSYLLDMKHRYPSLQLNPQDVSMHNLRRGGSVAAWEVGVDRDTIKGHDRWKSEVVQR
jgi:hypothetical protein